MKHFLLITALLIGGCSTPELKSTAITAKLSLKSNLKVYFLNNGIFNLYDFKNNQKSQLLTLQADVSFPSYDSNKEYFAFKDQGEKRLTIFSLSKKQIVYQKNFDTNRRIGFVKFSPRSKSVAVSWRSGGPKSLWDKGRGIDDSLLIIEMKDSSFTEKTIPKKIIDELTDLNWIDTKSITTATYDGKSKKSIMVSTKVKNGNRQIIDAFSFDYGSKSEAALIKKCGYNLEYSIKDAGKPIADIISIDKLLKSGNFKQVVPISQGLKTHPHGNNFGLKLTEDCNIGLLYHQKKTYAIDMKNNKITALFNGYIVTSYIKE